jgi:hypothetical protein
LQIRQQGFRRFLGEILSVPQDHESHASEKRGRVEGPRQLVHGNLRPERCFGKRIRLRLHADFRKCLLREELVSTQKDYGTDAHGAPRPIV